MTKVAVTNRTMVSRAGRAILMEMAWVNIRFLSFSITAPAVCVFVEWARGTNEGRSMMPSNLCTITIAGTISKDSSGFLRARRRGEGEAWRQAKIPLDFAGAIKFSWHRFQVPFGE